MKPTIIACLVKIAGDRLTPEMREQIVDECIKIMEDFNKAVAQAALDGAKKTIIEKNGTDKSG